MDFNTKNSWRKKRKNKEINKIKENYTPEGNIKNKWRSVCNFLLRYGVALILQQQQQQQNNNTNNNKLQFSFIIMQSQDGEK